VKQFSATPSSPTQTSSHGAPVNFSISYEPTVFLIYYFHFSSFFLPSASNNFAQLFASRGHYVGIHTSNFRDFMLKQELLRAVVDCGFEHPSEVQHECIPQAVLGFDIICQAKSGMGKTAVFVLSTLHQLTPVTGEVHVVVLCHTRELAFQIQREYERFCKYLPDVKSRVFYGGVNVKGDLEALKAEVPHIVVGTPGRIMDLATVRKALDLSKVRHRIA